MLTDAPVEEVFLTSVDEEDPLDTEGREVIARLEQRDGWRGWQRQLRLLSGEIVAVEERRRFKRRPRQYLVKLGFLDPRPRQQRRLDWRCLTAGGLLLLTAALLAYLASTALPLPLAVSALPLVPGALLLAWAAYRYRNDYLYATATGAAPLVTLASGRPDRDSANRFARELQSAIHAAAARLPTGHADRLAEEMREHRRLYHAGALNERRYEAAKSRILGAH